ADGPTTTEPSVMTLVRATIRPPSASTTTRATEAGPDPRVGISAVNTPSEGSVAFQPPSPETLTQMENGRAPPVRSRVKLSAAPPGGSIATTLNWPVRGITRVTTACETTTFPAASTAISRTEPVPSDAKLPVHSNEESGSDPPVGGSLETEGGVVRTTHPTGPSPPVIVVTRVTRATEPWGSVPVDSETSSEGWTRRVAAAPMVAT